MCFGSKDQSNDPAPKPAQMPQQAPSSSAPPSKAAQSSSDYAAPSGPPPSYGTRAGSSSQGDYAPPAGPPPRGAPVDDFAPPSGPPPSQNYAPPSGPPPSQSYAPPAGPPPSQHYAPPAGPPPSKGGDDYGPPPGPPPPLKQDHKHDWESAVPDTALLPPPPAFFAGFERSPVNNATEEESAAGERWVAEFPLYTPLTLDAASQQAVQSGNINVFTPPAFSGAIAQTALGVWKGHSYDSARDTCIATYPPLYAVTAHSPLATGRRKTAYYEVNLLADGSRGEISLALGFVAPPYPGFRLPGWHRGSLGVHGDDGHRYVNDRWGGKPFTKPFRRGETVGLGMDISPRPAGGLQVEIFLTRDGTEQGRWDLHEETDGEQDLPVTGLEGFHDLCAAVGVFDKVAFEIVFAPGRWKWKGYQG